MYGSNVDPIRRRKIVRSSQLKTWRLSIVGCALALGLTACASGDSEPSSTPSSDAIGGEVTVFAAASLTEAFTEIGEGFEAAYPDASVQFSFAGSTTLAQQIIQGAPAGVYASANVAQMQKVVDADLVVGEPTVFVQNKLQIVVPKGNPANVEGLSDFGNKELKIAICAEEVPCGAAAREAFAAAGITPSADTLEQDVKAVLTKVALGEADAGLVYVTDVASAGGDVKGIDFPEADQAVNNYPIVVLKDAPNPATANAFMAYVLSPDGQAVLKEFGFVTDVE